MKGKCKLYGTDGDLRSSHLMPKFVIDYLKQTGSKFLRRFEALNQRLQDGMKRYYLSHEAEQLFSEKEKWFAERIFRPFLEKGQSDFEYDQNLYYFLLSVLWRGLMQQLELPDIYQDPALKILQEVESDWRAYLAGEKHELQFSDVNLWLTDHIKSHDTGIKGLDYYFTRTIDFTVIADPAGDYICVYGKFLKFVFWSTIKDKAKFDNSGVTVKKEGGKINYPQNFKDMQFVETLVRRVKTINELPGPSAAQEQKIIDEVKKNPQAFIDLKRGNQLLTIGGWNNRLTIVFPIEMSLVLAEVVKNSKNAIGLDNCSVLAGKCARYRLTLN